MDFIQKQIQHVFVLAQICINVYLYIHLICITFLLCDIWNFDNVFLLKIIKNSISQYPICDSLSHSIYSFWDDRTIPSLKSHNFIQRTIEYQLCFEYACLQCWETLISPVSISLSVKKKKSYHFSPLRIFEMLK